MNKIIEILKNVPGSGMAYCNSRKRTKEIADLIKMHGISADHYHAGLTQEERSSKQEQWIQNKTRVIVCTNAFGMGIDKPDVRVVVHADIPRLPRKLLPGSWQGRKGWKKGICGFAI